MLVCSARVVVVVGTCSGPCLLCLACRCFGRSFPRVARLSANHASSARNTHCIIVSHSAGPVDRPSEPILMLTNLQQLQASLLRVTSTTRPIVHVYTPLLLSCALTTMAAKPSLKAAEDFLSFVNASPTRMSPLVCFRPDVDKSPTSFPCCQVSERALGKGRLQADQGMCCIYHNCRSTAESCRLHPS